MYKRQVLEESTSPIALENSEFFVELEDESRYVTKYKDNGQMDSSQANGEEADGILLEDFGVIVLDGTDATGLDAGSAGVELLKLGIVEVYLLKDGLISWQEESLPLVK